MIPAMKKMTTKSEQNARRQATTTRVTAKVTVTVIQIDFLQCIWLLRKYPYFKSQRNFPSAYKPPPPPSPEYKPRRV